MAEAWKSANLLAKEAEREKCDIGVASGAAQENGAMGVAQLSGVAAEAGKRRRENRGLSSGADIRGDDSELTFRRDERKLTTSSSCRHHHG